MKYEPEAWENVTTTARRMVNAADEAQSPVEAEFNTVQLRARPGDKPEDIVAFYRTELDCQRAKYEASPEGQAAKARQAEFNQQAQRAEADGILSFECIDKDGWDKTVAANDDPYGACAVRYAARWANYMEKALAAGETLTDCADRTSHEADKEGITGFMYGCAVGILAKAWKHGEGLRRWHNLKTQIRNEGEKANESGSVLNPAILSLGGN